MTAAWPGTLPQRFLISGNQHSPGENRLVSSNDTGPPKVRPRSSAMPATFAGSMRMTGAQWAILDAFVANDLGKGALPFIIPAPDGGDDWLVMFAQGGKPAKVNIGGDRWTVSMTLLVLP